MKDQICIEKNHFSLYVFLLFCLIVFFLYIITKKYEHMSNVDLDSHLANDELKNITKEIQKFTKYNHKRNENELIKENMAKIKIIKVNIDRAIITILR